jgi:hypothetical protein
MRKLRTLDEFTEGYFRAHPDEIDEYLTVLSIDLQDDSRVDDRSFTRGYVNF